MRKTFVVFMLSLAAATAVWAQTSSAQAPAATKTGTATKAPLHRSALTVTTAVFDTTAGPMHCVLFEKETPVTVANFIGLASGTKDWKNPVSGATKHGVPLYDGTIFHRVIPDFMIQGGDPAGNGSGDPGYKFKDEIVPTLTFDRAGRLAMANSGPGTNGSQFFITEVPTPHLNGRHTIFGQCDDATVELVKKIARMASDPRNNMPFRPVKIIHIKIVHSAPTAAKPATAPAATKAPAAAPAAPSAPN